jgi:putative ABC transport system permease protein
VRTVFHDARFSLRQLRRAPLFSAVIIIALGLGVGANTAIFSVVNAVFLRALPYGNADRLVTVWNDNLERGWLQFGTSLEDFLDWRQQSHTLENISALWTGQGNLSGPERPQRVGFATVSANLFGTLGTQPRLGRTFRAEEEEPGHGGVVIVSDGFWRAALGARPDAVGQMVDLDGQRLEVIGVMPPGFAFPSSRIALWKPLEMGPAHRESRGSRWLTVVASIDKEAGLAGATSEMAAIGRRLATEYPATNSGWTISLEPIRTTLTADRRSTILTAWIAVGLVLLIATANVANLLLARALGRGRELAVRAALGAHPRRLVQQLLTESLVFAILGTLLGLGIARVLMGWVQRLAPPGLPGGGAIVLDGSVLLFTAGLMVTVGIAFGTVPALKAGGVHLDAALKAGGRGAIGVGSRRFRDLLVVMELALAAMVLVGAGLTLRSFVRLLDVDPGFRTDHRMTLSVAPARADMPEREAAVAFYHQAFERIGGLPGVTRAGAVNVLPVPGGSWWTTSLYPEGRGYGAGEEPAVAARVVAGDYFGAMGIPLLRGRPLSTHDVAASEPVAVIDAGAADQLWPDADPIGQRVSFQDPGGDGPRRWYRIVGVVGSVRNQSLEIAPTPTVYTTLAQSQMGHFRDWRMAFVVETDRDPQSMAAALRREVQSIRGDLPVFEEHTMDEVVAVNVANRRFTVWLLTAFGSLALLLAAVGVYGLLATLVSERTREIGMRMALGAPPRAVLGLVLRDGLTRGGLGLALGLGAAALGSRFLTGLLYGVTPMDPVTYGGIAIVLLFATLVSAAVPAWRASRVDPMTALGSD